MTQQTQEKETSETEGAFPDDDAPPSEEMLPIAKTRGDVDELWDGDPDAPFEEKLARVNPIMLPANVFADRLLDTSFPSGVRENIVFGHFEEGDYDPPEDESPQNDTSQDGHNLSPSDPEQSSAQAGGAMEGESFPQARRRGPGIRGQLPWPGRRVDIWADGQTMLLGQAADPAFQDTEEECLRRARLQDSPYRAAGLSKEEAEKAERRRISAQTGGGLPDFEKALPTEKGETITRIGYLCRRGRRPSREGLRVLFNRQVAGDCLEDYPDRTEVPEGKRGVLSAKKRAMDLVRSYVKMLSPSAERKGRVRFTKVPGEWHNPIQVHLEGHSRRPETTQKIEEALGGQDAPPETLIGLVSPEPPRKQVVRLWQKIPAQVRVPGSSTTENPTTEDVPSEEEGGGHPKASEANASEPNDSEEGTAPAREERRAEEPAGENSEPDAPAPNVSEPAIDEGSRRREGPGGEGFQDEKSSPGSRKTGGDGSIERSPAKDPEVRSSKDTEKSPGNDGSEESPEGDGSGDQMKLF
jgi:hypothetical protein